jgi:thiamine pyrophosphokinase
MRAAIFANGEINDLDSARNLLLPGDTIIAADGGARHCTSLGISPSLLVGDFDSLTKAEVDDWHHKGAQIIHHDQRKDETDLELALLLAQGLDREEALVFGALGGRWDQTFANILLPAYDKLSGLKVTFWHNGLWIYLIRSRREIHGKAGKTVSLLPIGGDANGVTTAGLEWPLQDESLIFGATRGVSNLLVDAEAVVSVKTGMLLCFVFDGE